MYCKNCNKWVDSGESVCKHCGTETALSGCLDSEETFFVTLSHSMGKTETEHPKMAAQEYFTSLLSENGTDKTMSTEENGFQSILVDQRTKAENTIDAFYSVLNIDEDKKCEFTGKAGLQRVTAAVKCKLSGWNYSLRKGMALAICALFFCCAIVFALVSSNDNSEINKAMMALDAVLKKSESEYSDTPAYIKAIEERNGFEISSFEQGQPAIAIVTVYAPDVYKVAKEIDASGRYEDELTLTRELSEAIRRAEVVKKETKVYFEIEGNEYKPVLSEEFLDAYYGGIFRMRREMFAQVSAMGGIR